MLKAFSLVFLVVLMFLKTSAQPLYIKEYNAGDSFRVANQYDTAIQIFDRLLMKPIPDSLKAEVLHRKGVMFMSRKGAEDSALNFEQIALDIFTRQVNFTRMSRAESNISTLYYLKKIYDKALEHSLSALSFVRLPEDSVSQYLSLIQIYQALGEYQNMHDILVNHIRYFPNNLLPNQEFLTASYWGLYLANENRRDSALYYFKKALVNALSAKDSSSAYNNISDEYRLVHNYPLASAYLDSALTINRRTNDLVSELASYDTHTQIATEMHNYADAYKYSQLARELSDSIFKNGKANALLDAGVKYEAAKKEAANQLLEKDNIIKQRNFIFSLVGLGLLALLAAITFRSYKQKQKANFVLTNQKNELQLLTAQLEQANQTKSLLLSTIGHDLRSPLSSLYALLKMQEIKNSHPDTETLVMSHQVTGILAVLENLLAWSKLKLLETDLIPVAVLVNIKELFTEQTDFFIPNAVSKNIQIANMVADDLLVRCDEYILGTIFRNSIANAMNNSKPAEPVILLADKNGATLVCVIKNKCSQAGFENFQSSFTNATVQSGSHGLGLVLIKEFARIINASVTLSYADDWAMMNISLQQV